MDEVHQQRAIEALRDWSKWLIGLNFGTATGCIIVLQGGMKGPGKLFLIAAIISFALSVLCATFLGRLLAAAVEHLPLLDESGNIISISDYKLRRGLSVGSIARLQFALFFLGIVHLIAWVLLKAGQ